MMRFYFVKSLIYRLEVLSAFLEFTDQRSSFTVNNVTYSPSDLTVDDNKRNRFLLAEVLEGNINQGTAFFVPWFVNRELLNLHILRVVKRIAVNHADFAF